jgi:glycosyltransferase involved in cell wall biosynthesis
MGGAERVLVETIDILQEKGIECRVVLPALGELSGELIRLGVPFGIVPSCFWVQRGAPSLLGNLRSAMRIAVRTFFTVLKVKSWKCDVVYSNTIASCTGALAAATLRLPHIWHLHEFGYEHHRLVFQFGERRSCRALGSLSSACIAVSRALALKYLPYVPSWKLRVIYPSMHRAGHYGVGTDRSDRRVPARSGRFRCAIVGSLFEGKRQEDAVRALVYLAGNNIFVELLIVGGGDPSYRRHLEEIVRTNGVAGQVSFVGEVEDAFPFIQSSDVVLVCSRAEAFGRVTIEAMLAGKPVVGARSGANPELIQEGVTGLLYGFADARDLAEKVGTLYGDPGLIEHLGENGRRWAQTVFTKERYATEILAVLHSLSDRAAPGAGKN